MRKLTLEELAPYLPHGVSGVLLPQKSIINLTGIFYDKFGLHEVQINNDGAYALTRFKAILRPLSDLTKEIEYGGVKIIPLYRLMFFDKSFNLSFIETFGYEELKLSVFEKLVEMHFDVFGLIEAGLAIDINTLPKED